MTDKDASALYKQGLVLPSKRGQEAIALLTLFRCFPAALAKQNFECGAVGCDRTGHGESASLHHHAVATCSSPSGSEDGLDKFICDRTCLRAGHRRQARVLVGVKPKEDDEQDYAGCDYPQKEANGQAVCHDSEYSGGTTLVCAQARSLLRPNVRANRPAEASAVSPVRDDAPCAADRAYGACRSRSGGSARG